jgi:hypothetical protein
MHNTEIVGEAITRLAKLQDGKKKDEMFGYLKQDRELHGLLTSCSEELPDAPLYYIMPNMSHVVGCSTPPIDKVKAALINAGFRVSGYHKDAHAIKTDAPSSVMWDIMRAWCVLYPPNPKSKNKENKKKKVGFREAQCIIEQFDFSLQKEGSDYVSIIATHQGLGKENYLKKENSMIRIFSDEGKVACHFFDKKQNGVKSFFVFKD